MQQTIRKTILGGCLLLFCIQLLPAQNNLGNINLKKDTTSTDERQSDFLILDVTNDFWMEEVDLVEQRIWSPGITISIFKNKYLGKSSFAVAGGLGISSHNVHSNGYFQVVPATDSTSSFTRLEHLPDDYEKNKISSNYLEVPLELRYISKNSRPFRVHLGFKAGWLMNIHSKTIDDRGKRKFYDFENVNPFRYGVYTRIGWNYINAFAFYSLSPLLKEGRGHEIIPVSAGVSITL